MLRPIGDRIVVRPIKKPETTLAGIILAHQDEHRPQTGTVVSSNLPKIPIGATVHFGRLSGHAARLDDQNLTVLRAIDILAFE